MDSRQLTVEQVRMISAVIARQLRYLTRLRERMDRRQFPPSDTIYQLVSQSMNMLQRLHVALHYLACPPGSVG